MSTQGICDRASSDAKFWSPVIRWIDYRLPMAASIFVLFVGPWLDMSPVRSARFRPVFRVFFWILVADCVLLTYAGGKPPQGTWLFLSRMGAAYYFLHFLVVLPLAGMFEHPKPSDQHQPAGSATIERQGRNSRYYNGRGMT